MMPDAKTSEETIFSLCERYRQFSRSMNERERRLWAANEAIKLGRGGITIVSRALRISRSTIRRGMQDLTAAEADATPHDNARIRKPGGGRKSR